MAQDGERWPEMDPLPPIMCIVGRSGAGKTTFLERLIPALGAFGLGVAVIKHGHDFQVDRPGKDSWRLAQAGARSVVLSSPNQLALLEATDAEWPVERLAALTRGRVDLVLAEGYKGGRHPKIEVARAAVGGPLCSPEELLALVSADAAPDFEGVPRFAPTDAAAVAALLVRTLGLCRTPAGGEGSGHRRLAGADQPAAGRGPEEYTKAIPVPPNGHAPRSRAEARLELGAA